MKAVLLAGTAALVAAAALTAQHMGSANQNAPTITQKIEFGKNMSVELKYAAITWAKGQWAESLASDDTRGTMRDTINSRADARPLGTFTTTANVDIGGTTVAAGSYKLAFKLDSEFEWTMVLTGEGGPITVPLQLGDAPGECRRLVLGLYATDTDNTAAIHLAFGERSCELPIEVTPAGT